jgi:hypothetical protein
MAKPIPDLGILAVSLDLGRVRQLLEALAARFERGFTARQATAFCRMLARQSDGADVVLASVDTQNRPLIDS